jgi:hypothetical protein
MRAIRYAVLSLGLLSIMQSALATDPTEYLRNPIVQLDETEVELSTGVRSREHISPAERAGSFEIARGVTERWNTALAIHFHDGAGDPFRVDSVEWENIWQMFEQGEKPVDISWMLAFEQPQHAVMAPQAGNAANFTIGPMLQKDFGSVQANLNVYAVHAIRAQPGAATVVHWQSALKYRWMKTTEPGIEAFGTLLPRFVEFDQSTRLRESRLGPSLAGKFILPNQNTLVYDLSTLFRVSHGAPDRTIRLQVELEF